MSPNRDWFTTYETVFEGVVLMGNNASGKIVGVGTIKVKMFSGIVRTLSDVQHVPELKRNLISLSTLDLKGYKYTAESRVLKISKCSLVVMKRQRKTAKLYVLQGSTVTGDAAVASSSLSDDDITKLWHMCLGHMSKNGMVELSKRGLLDGRDHETLDSSSYSTAKWSCRTNEQNNHGEGSMYVIKCQLTEVVLGRSNLYCIFFINRSSSVAIDKKTPQEVWSGNPGNYSDLKIFGCPVYALVDNGKLEPRSIKCVFLGYKASVKRYKLWCPKNRKVVISRDVVFDETAILPNLSLKDSSNKENQKQVEHQINIELTPHASTKIENRVASSPQYSIAKNRTKREIKPPKKYAEANLVTYALNVAEDIDANQEPSNYSKVISGEDSEKWMFAMQEEMESLYKNKTWDLVKLPKSKKTGYSQIPGVDFTDVLSLVVKYSSIRALLGIVAMHDLELEQLDVKTAFLHGELKEDIYIQQPEGFTVSEKEDYACLLKKSLYSLKQSPRQWYKRFDSFMTSHDFKRSSFDSCVYFKKNSDGSFVYLLLYTNDMLIAAKDKKEIRKSAKPVSTPLAAHFRLSSALSPQSDDEIKYMSHVSYSSAVGSIIYAMVYSRPDLSYAVSAVSRYMANLGKEHWKAVQWILRYLRGTTDVCLQFRRTKDRVIGGCAISWKATLQTTVTLSTTEAEYMTITEACKEVIWLKGLFSELNEHLQISTTWLVFIVEVKPLRGFMEEVENLFVESS
ncbi:hypothetical protein CXB51_010032 [Gossypium anomalum]|uniref:Reverse transcriptase Ty1/copia-type domain-containing protein n=1 Tax=Gossypium anomalum TaxID=47600 RepID=A0A8J6D3X6_9ROSI|nr:hypothetical protein CXB51_010032 [Gossypium anomalum]